MKKEMNDELESKIQLLRVQLEAHRKSHSEAMTRAMASTHCDAVTCERAHFELWEEWGKLRSVLQELQSTIESNTEGEDEWKNTNQSPE